MTSEFMRKRKTVYSITSRLSSQYARRRAYVFPRVSIIYFGKNSDDVDVGSPKIAIVWILPDCQESKICNFQIQESTGNGTLCQCTRLFYRIPGTSQFETVFDCEERNLWDLNLMLRSYKKDVVNKLNIKRTTAKFYFQVTTEIQTLLGPS